MISVQAALRKITSAVKTLDAETVSLSESLGRALAQAVYSDADIPGFDNSAMDGYAVKSADTKGASKDTPRVLEAVCDIKAGDIPEITLARGQAARIMTGAVLPKGADAVVMAEDTDRLRHCEPRRSRGEATSLDARRLLRRADGVYTERSECVGTPRNDGVAIFKQIRPGENVRYAGEDIRKGEIVIQKGALLKPAHIGLLASLGKARLKVVRRPMVAVLATGDELADVKGRLKPGQIRSSNTYSLCAQIINAGGIPKNLGIAKDDPQELEKKIKQGLDCDLLITSGGVSVGDYDLVKGVLAKIGTDVKFWKIAMKPGRPLVFGTLGGKPVFGLPGNPVSSMVSFEAFVRPALLKMSGRKYNDEKHEVEAAAGEDITKRQGLTYFLRANTRWRQGVYWTKTTGPQGSGILKSMALADSLIILPQEKEVVRKGERVTVRFLD